MIGIKLFLVLSAVLIISKVVKILPKLMFAIIPSAILFTFFTVYCANETKEICITAEQRIQNTVVDNSDFNYWRYRYGEEQELSVFDGKRIYPVKVKISDGEPEFYIPTSMDRYYKKL